MKSDSAMDAQVASPRYSDSMCMKEARDLFLASNHLSVEGYSAPTFTLRVLGLPLKFPNTAARKRAVPLHDLHHVLTGYGTNWMGEAEIGAWELRAGCNSFITYFLNGGGVIIGMLLSPSRVWRAFRAAKGQHTLYLDSLSYERLLQMSIAEVRQRLRIPPQGFANASMG